MESICVIGLGYIGLPTALMFASAGLKVKGVDVDSERVRTLNDGISPFDEEGLSSLLANAIDNQLFCASNEASTADYFIISVPTPFKRKSKAPDLSYVFAAANSICDVLKKGDLVVLESTVPPGTTIKLQKYLESRRPDLVEDGNTLFHVVHCPERVIPGNIVSELQNNDRVIGAETNIAAQRAVNLFDKILVEGACTVVNSSTTAEMVKLTENSFRDVNIAFANELSLICDNLGIDHTEVISAANKHPRVNILNAGPGVGGHCIAVDPWFIVSTDPSNSKLIQTARLVNDEKPSFVVNKIVSAAHSKAAETIVLYGMTYKADVDDIRESPSLKILEMLKEKDELNVVVVEPNLKHDSIDGVPNKVLGVQNQNFLHVLLVPHKQFKSDGMFFDLKFCA